MSPLLSVIIVNFNAGSELHACVKSVFTSTAEIEVIVVDNNSKDNSLELLDDTFSGESRLRILKNNENLGFAVACNQGSKSAVGDFFLYLNPDCRVTAETIPQLLSCFERNPEAGMVGGLILNDDGTEQRGCRRRIPTPWSSLVNIFGLSRFSKVNKRVFQDFRQDHDTLPEDDLAVEAISGACMCIPKKLYFEVGPMDEGYFLHCEDLDWCMQFGVKGYDIIFTPLAKLFHSKGSCSHSIPVFVEWHKHRGMVRFYRKFFKLEYPLPFMWIVYTGIWLRFCLLLTKFSFLKIVNRLRYVSKG